MGCINNRVVTDKDFVKAGGGEFHRAGKKTVFQTYGASMEFAHHPSAVRLQSQPSSALELQRARLLAKTLTGRNRRIHSIDDEVIYAHDLFWFATTLLM